MIVSSRRLILKCGRGDAGLSAKFKHKLKAEVQEVEAVKKCVEQIVQPKQIRAKTQSRKNDMEL